MAESRRVEDVEQNLDEATRQLRMAIANVAKLAPHSPWKERSDDLDVLKEEIVDIRQQLLLLKLEVDGQTAPPS